MSVVVEELLAPIASDDPTGPDLSDSDEYARIEREYREADLPASVSPEGVPREPDADFGEVVELAADFLRSQSKDLKIAALLAAALLRERGFAGLADGLRVCRGFVEAFWDELHPGVAGRAAVLGWLGSEDVSYAVYLVSLTEDGHNYFHYKEWAKRQEEGEDEKAGEAEEGSSGPSARNFGQSFAQLPRSWYEDVCSSLERAGEELEALDSLGREKFPEEDERPPSYRDLTDTLKRVTSAARDLLGRKPPSPPSERRVAPEKTEEDAGENDGDGADGEGGTTRTPVSAEPRSPEEAAAAVVGAARLLRHTDSGDPVPYLLLRSLRWGELRSGGEDPDPRLLVPPRTEERTRVKSLFLDQAWEEVLEVGEEVMATPAGRAWLDLQRYELLAAERLGAEYRRVAEALEGALRGLLADVPTLTEATLMDDSAAASRDTLSWLESQGLIEGGENGGSTADADSDTEAERKRLRASFSRAENLVRAGDPQGAVELLMDRAEYENSQRARFLVKAKAAGIMVRNGMKPVARPILDELHRLIEEHKLEAWESGDTVAEPLGLLYQCLAPTDSNRKQQLYERLAKLDPLLAMQVREDGTSGAGAAQEAGGGDAGEGGADG